LRLQIRLTNNDAYPTNFWNRTFRLFDNGVPRSPISDLNESVEGHSAREGIVEFIVPTAVPEVQLQLLAGNETAEIPIALTESRERPSQREPSGLPSPTRFLRQTSIALPLQNFGYSSASDSRTTMGIPPTSGTERSDCWRTGFHGLRSVT
jgi:hypothetical protein